MKRAKMVLVGGQGLPNEQWTREHERWPGLLRLNQSSED